MRLKQCFINGVDVCEAGKGVLFTNTDWTSFSSDIQQDTLSMRHSRYTWPMQVTKRVITLEGVIDFETWELWLSHLKSIFAPQENLYKVDQMTMMIVDVFDNERECEVVVVDPLDYDEYSNDFLWYAMKWRVVLETTGSPFVKWTTELSVSWNNGTTGLLSVDFDVPFDMNEAWNAITINNTWNAQASIRREIEVIEWFASPLTIYNLTSWTYTRFDISWLIWDIIIIDTDKKTATKNGVSILPYRLFWSSRSKTKWSSTFVVQVWTDLSQSIKCNIDAFFYITDL